MGHAQRKTDRLYIPARDKSKVAHPRAVLGHDCNHQHQVDNALRLTFVRYEKALEELSKV